jgi:hypothetical protein
MRGDEHRQEHRQGMLNCRERIISVGLSVKDVRDGEEEQGHIQLTVTANTAK